MEGFLLRFMQVSLSCLHSDALTRPRPFSVALLLICQVCLWPSRGYFWTGPRAIARLKKTKNNSPLGNNRGAQIITQVQILD